MNPRRPAHRPRPTVSLTLAIIVSAALLASTPAIGGNDSASARSTPAAHRSAAELDQKAHRLFDALLKRLRAADAEFEALAGRTEQLVLREIQDLEAEKNRLESRGLAGAAEAIDRKIAEHHVTMFEARCHALSNIASALLVLRTDLRMSTPAGVEAATLGGSRNRARAMLRVKLQHAAAAVRASIEGEHSSPENRDIALEVSASIEKALAILPRSGWFRSDAEQETAQAQLDHAWELCLRARNREARYRELLRPSELEDAQTYEELSQAIGKLQTDSYAVRSVDQLLQVSTRVAYYRHWLDRAVELYQLRQTAASQHKSASSLPAQLRQSMLESTEKLERRIAILEEPLRSSDILLALEAKDPRKWGVVQLAFFSDLRGGQPASLASRRLRKYASGIPSWVRDSKCAPEVADVLSSRAATALEIADLIDAGNLEHAQERMDSVWREVMEDEIATAPEISLANPAELQVIAMIGRRITGDAASAVLESFDDLHLNARGEVFFSGKTANGRSAIITGRPGSLRLAYETQTHGTLRVVAFDDHGTGVFTFKKKKKSTLRILRWDGRTVVETERHPGTWIRDDTSLSVVAHAGVVYVGPREHLRPLTQSGTTLPGLPPNLRLVAATPIAAARNHVVVRCELEGPGIDSRTGNEGLWLFDADGNDPPRLLCHSIRGATFGRFAPGLPKRVQVNASGAVILPPEVGGPSALGMVLRPGMSDIEPLSPRGFDVANGDDVSLPVLLEGDRIAMSLTPRGGPRSRMRWFVGTTDAVERTTLGYRSNLEWLSSRFVHFVGSDTAPSGHGERPAVWVQAGPPDSLVAVIGTGSPIEIPGHGRRRVGSGVRVADASSGRLLLRVPLVAEPGQFDAAVALVLYEPVSIPDQE